MEPLVSLAKRRGFVYPSAELYGGIGGFYDFGPLGVQLKRNIEALWWKVFVEERDDVYGLASAIIAPPSVWKASGHLEHFTDPMVECKVCHERLRADEEQGIAEHAHDDFTEVKRFNTMFKTHVGPVEGEGSDAYLRPETAQGMFTNFMNVIESTRAKVPFGIAQIGKSFRNEITFRNFIFRMREFVIAELEYFVEPGEDEKAFDAWMAFMEDALTKRFGIEKGNLKRYEHPKDTLAHYSKRTVDLYYKYPWGWDELWAIANRTDFDLTQHEKASRKELKYRDPKTGKAYLPYVIEPTGGIERLFLAILAEAYTVVKGGRTKTTEATKEEEVVLALPKELAPVKIAVLPLSKKAELASRAREVQQQLARRWVTNYDETASIGRRYRRQDEIGTPYCVTVDFETLEDHQVTVRDRDTMEQERIAIDDLEHYFEERFHA